MSTQVGVIDLGLEVDRNTFNRQVNGIARGAERSTVRAFGGLGKKIGAMLGVAAVTAFTKQCLSMGSALSEVQNVVDVTFGALADEINRFANTAITQFGLSETAAKKYASTIGAMLKSMGIGTQQAVEMAKVTAGLSADMASFYNLSSEEAFAKLRSGISGETEPLKQLGINLSVANLEAFALSQGITKAYKNMSEAEKVMLRYNYILKVTKDAQGDFARTSDSWANQTRILSEQFKALQASIGQGLIAAFTPLIKSLNVLMAKLVQAGNTFKSFMELIFGKGSTNGGMGQVSNDVAGITEGASDAGDAITGMGDATTDAAKKAKGALAGFDELNQLTMPESGDLGSAGGTDFSFEAPSVDFGEVSEDVTVLEKKFKKLTDSAIREFKRLSKLFKKGFDISIGASWKIKPNEILKSFESIKESIVKMFDVDLIQAFKRTLDQIVVMSGNVVGSLANVGLTIGSALVGGVDSYLQQSSKYIKDRLIGIFDVTAEISLMVGEWGTVIADIFTVFGEETFQDILGNILSILNDTLLSATEISLKIGKSIVESIMQPIVDNKDKIKESLRLMLAPIETLTGAMRDALHSIFKSVLDDYDQYIEPTFKNIGEGFSKLVSGLLDTYEKYIAPTINTIAEMWADMYTEHLAPTIDKIVQAIGKFAKVISELWKNYVAPFVAWMVDLFAPTIMSIFENGVTLFTNVVNQFLDLLGSLAEGFGGLIDFLTGVFTGDWELAWEGVKSIFSGIVGTFEAIIVTPLKNIISYVSNSFTSSWRNAWNGVGKIVEGVFDTLTGVVRGSMNIIISAINTMISGINKFKIDIPDWVSDIPGLGNFGGRSIGFDIPTIPKLARGGIIDQPTIAMVGEAGREAVVPLENNTEWVGKMAELVTNALLPLLGGGIQNDNREVVVNLDGVELVRALIPTLLKESKRQGVVYPT